VWCRPMKRADKIVLESSDYNLGTDQFEQYTKILIITLWRGGYPHEILCCMFNKCFGGYHDNASEPNKVDGQEQLFWSPRKIVNELSNISLAALSERLELEYITFSLLPEDLVNACFRILGIKMHKKVVEIIKPMDRDVRKRWSRILESLVGKTVLSDYLSGHPEDNVSDWSYRVARKVNRVLIQEKWLERPIEQLLDAVVTS